MISGGLDTSDRCFITWYRCESAVPTSVLHHKSGWLVAPMGGSPRATKCSERNLALRRDFCAPLLSNALELRDQTSQTHSPHTQECVCEVCSRNSKALKSSGAQKSCTVTHGGDRGDRRGAVAARVTKTERQPPDIMAGPSRSIHSLPSLARGPTGKAVLALEVRTRTLHGHAPWTRTGAPRWHRRQT